MLHSAAAVDLVFDIASSKTCSRHSFAVLRADSCRTMVIFEFGKVLQPSTLFFDIATSTTCSRQRFVVQRAAQPYSSSSTLPHRRPVPDTFSLLSDHGQLLVRESTATVDPLLRHCHLDDLAPTTLRSPSCRSLSGNRQLGVLDCAALCCSRRPRLRHCLAKDLFPPQFRCPSCRFLSGHGQLVVWDGAA